MAAIATACETTAPSGPAGTPPNLLSAAATAPVPTPDTGLRVFNAPGITFTYPSDWQPVPHPSAWQDTWALRNVGFLQTGPPTCWDIPMPWPSGCDAEGLPAGSLSLIVSEYPRAVPGEELYGRPTSLEPAQRMEAGQGRWYVTDPYGGIYLFNFVVPFEDLEDRRPDIDRVLDSVVLSDWQRPSPVVVDGWARVERFGVSISYPAGWHAYAYLPGGEGMTGSGGPRELISSTPVDPCIPVDECHLRNPPAMAVVLQLGWSASPFWEPRWHQRANDEVAGHPAIRHGRVVLDGVELQDWDIQRFSTGNEAVHVRVAAAEGADEALWGTSDELIHRLRFSDKSAAP